MKIKKLPNVLALHLKRFKYQEDVARYIKLAYRVAFPFELRLFNTVDDMDDADRLYNLFAIVVHVGKYVCPLLFLLLCCSCLSSGPHHGHYISIIKTAGNWFVFDDVNVYQIPENDIPKYFGDSNSGSAYVLYYQAVDIDLVSLGLRPLDPLPEMNLIPRPQSSTLQDQTSLVVPALPPGLHSSPASSESEAECNHFTPPTAPSPVPLYHSEPEELVTPPISISIPQSRDISTTSSAATSSPMPSGFGTKLINTIRRAPSRRGSIGGTSSGHVPNGGGERRSTVEKTPRPSVSTPSFVPSESSQEQPPPLPPLPPGIMNRSNSPLNVTPTLNAQVTDSKKEKEKEKEKDKTRLTTGSWFNKKRKSLRIGDKSRSESGVPDPSSFRANGAVIPTHPISPRPDALRSEKSERDHWLNGYRRKPPPEPSSLFPGSSFRLSDTPSTSVHPSHPQSRSSTLLPESDPGSGTQFDPAPSRKSSLGTSSADRYHSRKKSTDIKSISPSSAARPLTASSTPSFIPTEYNRSLPLLPPTPFSTTSLPPSPKITFHRTNQSLNNGQIFFTEPQNTVNAMSADVDGDKLTYLRSIPISESPASIAASVGQNSSVGSTNSVTSNIKQATRKLSLGFGKRDKEKDRERGRLSPSGRS